MLLNFIWHFYLLDLRGMSIFNKLRETDKAEGKIHVLEALVVFNNRNFMRKVHESGVKMTTHLGGEKSQF